MRRREAAICRFVKHSDLSIDKINQAPPLPIPSPVRSVIGAMRFSSEPTIAQFLKVYDSIPAGDQKHIPLKAVALKAGCNFNELLGAIVMCFIDYQKQKIKMMAMMSHPKVLEDTILYAQLPGGVQDRRTLHQAVGFLPTPQGSTFNFNLDGKRGKDDSEQDDTPPDVNDIFPLVTSKQEAWQGNRQKLLSAGD